MFLTVRMGNPSAKWRFFTIIMISLVIIEATFAGPIFALNKSSISPSRSIMTSTDAGIKILNVHTLPSTVVVGNTFSIQGTVINNSTAIITFPNGTCNSPLSIDFNKNVMIQNQAVALCTTSTPVVALRPGEQSGLLYPYPHLSGIVYRAIAPGMTNATITFSYGIQAISGNINISTDNSISRLHTFNIQSGSAGSTANDTFNPPGVGKIKSTRGGLLSINYPDNNVVAPIGTLIAVGGTSAPSNATHTNCNVGIKINQHGFVQASPKGPKGAGDYTKWTAITTSPTQRGLNQIEAQLLCFPPGKVSTPNLIKHLVHNVTGIPVIGIPTSK